MEKIISIVFVLITASAFAQDRKPALDTLLKLTDTVQQKIKLERMLMTGTLDDQETLVLFYNVKTNWTMRDSVIYSAARRFPSSEWAFEAARMDLMKMEDPNQQWKQYLAIRKKFSSRKKDGMGFGMMETALVSQRVDSKDLKHAIAYMDSITNPIAFAFAARQLYSLSPSKTEKLLKNFISKYGTAPQNGRSTGIAATYGHILIRNGKIKQAAPFVKEAYEQAGNRRSVELVMDYATILRSENNFPEVISALEELVKKGQGNPDIRTQLGEMYKKTNRDADAAFKEINEALSIRIQEEVAHRIINTPSPNFIVKNKEEKKVSLSDFKGKTIVVDFWATWCGPCKKSFPAMQQALNRYKNDSSVAFLFIHTWEHGAKDPKKDAEKYLLENNYSFDLYMDVYDSTTKTNPAVTAFGIKGIPTKYVIDGVGNIRFKVDGFSGLDEATTEEMSAMIELTKNSK